jgi:creatinine amidohydrolase
VIRLADVPWLEAAKAKGERWFALLPVGSTEAHGPHLPLCADVVIAEAMAVAAAQRIEAAGVRVLLLPSLPFGVTDCASDFFGTISISAASVRSLVVDVAASLQRQGCARLGLANAHLEPAHRHTLRVAAEAATKAGLATLFPDVVRGVHAKRLDAEFQSGACHAGSFESSIVMAARPELVKEGVRVELPANPTSLGEALAAGKRTFVEAGGADAYFGDPAGACCGHGRALVAELGAIVAEEMLRESA